MKKRIGVVLILCVSLMFLIALPAFAEDPVPAGIEESLTAKYDAYQAEQAKAEALSQLEAATTEAERQAILDELSDVLPIGIQTTSELVLYPLNPCRIVDTRNATRWGFHTPIPAGGTITLWTYGPRPDQGGVDVSGCGVISDAAAVVVNVTSVPVSGQGYLTVWPYNSSKPNASLINYKTGVQNVANAVVQSQCRGCASELNVYSSATSHVIIDVIGYFARPTATALDIVTLSNTQSVVHNTPFTIFSPPCTSGYTMTGGGCEEEFISSERVVMRSQPYDDTYWLCKGNNYAGTQNVTAHIVCAKVPGR
jgi:hypothetical protein